MLIACTQCGVVTDAGPYRRACGSCAAPLTAGAGNVGFPERLTANSIGSDHNSPGSAPTTPAQLNAKPATQSVSAVDTAIRMVNPATDARFQDPAYGQWEVTNSNLPEPIFGLPEQRVALRGVWDSPVFDLRPDLAGDTRVVTRGIPIYRGGELGQGTRLILRLKIVSDGDLSSAFYNYQFVTRVGYLESDADTQGLEQVHAAQSVTASIWNNKAVPFAEVASFSTYTQLVFIPPANPVRFWQVSLVVDRMVRYAVEVDGEIVPFIPPPTNTHFVTHWVG